MKLLTNNKLLLGLGVALLVIGLLKPDISNLLPSKASVVNNTSLSLEEPTEQAVKDACLEVTQVLRDGSSDRKYDGMRLASLYCDLANLVSLDGDEQAIKSTLEIREANKLAGKLCRLNLKDKYDGLSEAANGVLIAALGDDDAVLDTALRQKAVSVFRNLAWACVEGAK